MSLSNNISSYLESNGIRQNFIAETTGMTPNAVWLILKGKRKLSADEYIKICDSLGVSYDFFVDEKSA